MYVCQILYSVNCGRKVGFKLPVQLLHLWIVGGFVVGKRRSLRGLNLMKCSSGPSAFFSSSNCLYILWNYVRTSPPSSHINKALGVIITMAAFTLAVVTKGTFTPWLPLAMCPTRKELTNRLKSLILHARAPSLRLSRRVVLLQFLCVCFCQSWPEKDASTAKYVCPLHANDSLNPVTTDFWNLSR